MPAKKLGFLARHPWLFVVAAFLVMFTAWGVMFSVAASHPVTTIPLVSTQNK